jgi:hypothetical protein
MTGLLGGDVQRGDDHMGLPVDGPLVVCDDILIMSE